MNAYEKAIEELREHLICPHKETQRAYRVYSNGSKHYGEFCLCCATKVKPIKKCTLLRQELLIVPELDKDIKENWNKHRTITWSKIHELQRVSYAEKQETERVEWWHKYNAYLTTQKWRDKRDKVLKRDKCLCQACLERQATAVHHLTYERVGDEPLFDLVSICQRCHDYLHGRRDDV